MDPQYFQNAIEPLLKPDGIEEMESVLMEPLYFMSPPTVLRPIQEPLKAGGATLRVTEANKAEYIKLLCDDYVFGGMRAQYHELVAGFLDVVPETVLSELNIDERDLSILVEGCPEIDVEDWRLHAEVVRSIQQENQSMTAEDE